MNRAVLQTALAMQKRQMRPAVWRLADSPRFFAKNKKKQGGGQKPLTLQLCYSSRDLEEDPVESYNTVTFNKPPMSMKDIMKKLEDFVDAEEMDEGVEYYADGEWKELKNPTELKGGTVPIRMPSTYVEDDDYDNEDFGDEFDEDYAHDDDSTEISNAIKEFVDTLKEQGYTRSTEQLQLKSKDGESISTKEWVLNHANENKHLQTLLLSNVGGLDHVVQCLHYDFLWAEQQPEGGPEQDELESD